MIANTATKSFDVDVILTHKLNKVADVLPNGPLIVIDKSGNVVRSD